MNFFNHKFLLQEKPKHFLCLFFYFFWKKEGKEEEKL